MPWAKLNEGLSGAATVPDMPGLLPDVDPDGLLEYSVVYTDRAKNHMSADFQQTMRHISSTLKQVYNAEHCAVVPGSGTFGMEAVARQLVHGDDVLILRNGWFSFRWTQIFEAAGIAGTEHVMMAQPVEDGPNPGYAPAPIDEVTAAIAEHKPAVVFAPHVETSAGMILPDDYISAVAAAVHEVGGLFVLDCIASGTIWVDMAALGVDVLVSAPQKGWSGPPCAGLVLANTAARERMNETASSSFAADLKKWFEIMEAYEGGGHAYHATMPTDSLTVFSDVIKETATFGFSEVKAAQADLGSKIRGSLADNGFKSVAADGFAAPGVVVCYTDDPSIKSGQKFAAQGLQIAGGVPLRVGEPDDFSTFRIGLFGLDKLTDVDAAVQRFDDALGAIND